MTGDESTDPRVEARRAAERLIETPGGPQALLQLERLFETVRHERGVNDDSSETVAPAQEAVIDVLHGVSAAAGADKSILRRVVGFALDKPRASDAEVEQVLAGIEANPDATSKAQRNLVRSMTMRAVVDLRLIPKRVTSFPAWSLHLGATGRSAVPGEVFAPSLVSGVDPDSGPFETLKSELVGRIGYTAGYEQLPVSRRLSSAILRRARAAWRDMRRRSKTPIPDVQAGTIRKWCGSAGGAFKYSEQFNLAYQQGRAAHATGKIAADKLLPP
jgi:hypothetical protein